jgi:uncharacterized cupredoxin-like copper-binding protein
MHREQRQEESILPARRSRVTRRWLVPLAAVAAAVLLLPACGGGSNDASSTTDGSASSEGTTLQLAADPSGNLEFDKTTLEAPAGKVTIVLTNDSSVLHDVAIEGNGVDVKSDEVDNGGTASVSATLEPGTYTFVCTVPGHEEAGMKGTLTIT